jgi:hypothetical protein
LEERDERIRELEKLLKLKGEWEEEKEARRRSTPPSSGSEKGRPLFRRPKSPEEEDVSH